MKNPKGLFILLVLTGVSGAFVGWKIDAVSRLRGESARLQADIADRSRLAELNARYKSAPPVVDTSKLQRDADSVPVLKKRIENFKESLSRLSALPPPAVGTAADYTVLWKNAGRLTPTNTLHSIIWASLNGDVDALGSMLSFDPDSREDADALWAGLPASIRAQYPTSQKLFATLIAGRLSTGLFQAEWREQTQEQPDLIRTRFDLYSASPRGMEVKSVYLHFRKQDSNWRLTVPKSVVAEFQRVLQAK